MKRTLAAILLLAAAPAWPAPTGTVRGSKHDLSVTGPGPIRATNETDVCVFCHVMHGARPGLSSRPDTTAKHLPYESSTVSARPGAPTGASRVCLSCHDGTIAVGKIVRREIRMTVRTIPEGNRSNLGTDLRGTHPVSFKPTGVGHARRPDPGSPAHLDKGGEVQCTSCHDPHVEWNDPVQGKFLVMPNRSSQLCRTCHDDPTLDAAGASHSSSTKTFGPSNGNEGKFATIAEAGCAACHVSHGGTPSARLRRADLQDDDADCLRCHATTVTRVDVGREVTKAYGHDARKSPRGHDAAEGRPGGKPLPETSAGAPRHAACVDCHDPHAATNRPAMAPQAPGALAGVWGVDLNGQRVQRVQFEYEVCFKCHGDSANKGLAAAGRALDSVRRASGDTNLRRVFAPSSASAHPVVTPGRNPDVPSLKAPYTPGSMIYCSDCHASESGPGAGGIGARGPHGSIYPHLLERAYPTADRTVDGPSSYALCYKCHDRDVLQADAKDAFRVLRTTGPKSLHRVHVFDQTTPCSACHAGHGVSLGAGRPTENMHLIDFDLSIVKPGPGGAARYDWGGQRSGSCNLSCHGSNHTSATHAY
jgi:predicted CXXCH cytochrome family protein